ncbi:unnamed protein product [Rhizoctonia solani]|uniref:Methyltransferase type 11 domain-containing protein n=1 Tax=Rhizoctonia solani TaxID=456999 RepID=A0A8H2WB08_9AGAM|nr:unnamed protein product [Rhizoctonia solani]
MAEPNNTAKHDWKPASYNEAPNERIVDLGCGTGELTLRLEELVGQEGLVIGVDASESMLGKAKENGVANLFCSDIQNLMVPNKFKDFTGTFDAVFTNLALHWCKQNPHGAVRAAKTLLRPGGRFVGEFGGHMNGVGLRHAIAQVLERRGKVPSDPWFLPQPEEYTKILESEGFKVEHISINPQIIILERSLADFVYGLFRASYLKDVEDEEAREIAQEVSGIYSLRAHGSLVCNITKPPPTFLLLLDRRWSMFSSSRQDEHRALQEREQLGAQKRKAERMEAHERRMNKQNEDAARAKANRARRHQRGVADDPVGYFSKFFSIVFALLLTYALYVVYSLFF